MTNWLLRRWFRPMLLAVLLSPEISTMAACSSPSPLQPTPVRVPSPIPLAQDTYTLTVGATTVVAGHELTVAWTASRPGKLDWIALYRRNATNVQHGWYDYVDGANSGTFTLKAPIETGQYEFRYLIDDSYFDVLKSAPITVEKEKP